MTEENRPVTALDLELNNKIRANEQAHEINRGLTRLKKISSRPELIKKPRVDDDRTGNFIVVPVSELLSKDIEEAVVNAGKSCSILPPTAKKVKKKWFSWDSK